MLAARGFRTAAFVSGWTLRGQLTGLDRGFDVYDDEMTDRYKVVNNQRPGDETADRAVITITGVWRCARRWAARKSRPSPSGSITSRRRRSKCPPRAAAR